MLSYRNDAEQYNKLLSSIEQYFPKNNKTHKFLCVDCIPLSVFKGPLCYGVLEYDKGKEFSLEFKQSFSSNAKSTNVLRAYNINSTGLLAGLQKIIQILDARDKTEDTIKNIREALEPKYLEIACEYISDTEVATLASQMSDLINEFTDTVAYLEERDWADANTKLKKICEGLKAYISEFISQPDTVLDFIGYAAMSTGNLAGDYRVYYIPEIGAINIETPYLQQLKETNPAQYDIHMFLANYEMLRLFTYKFHAGNYKYPPQNTLSILTEYVPIAMKFKNIYNPLFDSPKGVWNTLCRNYRWMQTVECTDNKCAFTGFVIDSSSSSYDASDHETYHLSRIYYALCSSIDEAFNREQTPIIPTREAFDGILYTTDLAAAIIFKMLVNEGFFNENDLAGRIAWYDDTTEDRSYISICSALQKPLSDNPFNHASHSSFVYTMIYRTLLTNDSRSYKPLAVARDAGVMQQQFDSIILNTFGGF